MTQIIIASRTLTAIADQIASDNGNLYRHYLGLVTPTLSDAYRSDEDGRRSHLGASVIGNICERAVFYAHRWVSVSKPPTGYKYETPNDAHSRMLRLWNRGHQEEGRFIAMLAAIGVQIYQQDANGKQFRIHDFGGHFSGSGDGIALGIPDFPPGIPCLLEFKTHGDDSFKDLVKKGVRISKPVHFVQMQIYMRNFGLMYALYMSVNKNTDEIHAEIVQYEGPTADWYMERARRILFDLKVPARFQHASPGVKECKFCSSRDVCYGAVKPERNCRSCVNFNIWGDGTMRCDIQTGAFGGGVLSKQDQINACGHYELSPLFK